jgi:hypothetical protein
VDTENGNAATIPASTLSAGTYLVNANYDFEIIYSGSGTTNEGLLKTFQMNVTQTSAQVGETPSNTNLTTYSSNADYTQSTGPYIVSAKISGTMYLANTTTPIYITIKVTYDYSNPTLKSAYCQFTRIA